jgi:serine/threonine-protein kinase HipA
MDICGEGRAPARKHLLQLASMTGVYARSAEQVIERIATVAGGFRAFAAELPITRETLNMMESRVEANRSRMA